MTVDHDPVPTSSSLPRPSARGGITLRLSVVAALLSAALPRRHATILLPPRASRAAASAAPPMRPAAHPHPLEGVDAIAAVAAASAIRGTISPRRRAFASRALRHRRLHRRLVLTTTWSLPSTPHTILLADSTRSPRASSRRTRPTGSCCCGPSHRTHPCRLAASTTWRLASSCRGGESPWRVHRHGLLGTSPPGRSIVLRDPRPGRRVALGRPGPTDAASTPAAAAGRSSTSGGTVVPHRDSPAAAMAGFAIPIDSAASLIARAGS